MTFHDILAKYRAVSFSERDKGDRFERLMQAFLLTIPWYEGKFRHVWLWRELSYKQNLGSKAESAIHHQEPPVRWISLTALQNAVADRSKEINTADASKLIGGINALSRRMLVDEGLFNASEPPPLCKAVAFSGASRFPKGPFAIRD